MIWALFALSGVVTSAIMVSPLPAYWVVVSGLVLGGLGYEIVKRER